MSLDRAISTLNLLKPATKLVPGVGAYLEAVVDTALEGCKYAKEVKSNKEENRALTERAIRCLAVVIEKVQNLPESEVNKWMTTIGELRGLVHELERMMKQRAQRRLPSRAWHKASDKEEIENLKKRLDQIIERFGVQTQFVLINDVEDALGRIKDIQNLQTQIKENQTKADQIALLDRLRPIMNARHDHQDAPQGCTKDTRVDILNLMLQWALNQLAVQPIFWLCGLAGTGKSAIMKTLSQLLASEGVLGGCFFISIQSADRRNPQNIIRTLIHQLAEFQPILRKPICSVVRDCPTIVDQEMAIQAPKLLSDTFTPVVSRIRRPIVIMIDALDECEKKDNMEGGQFLKILLDVISQHPAKLKLIITSRLTPTIQRVMSTVTAERLQLHEIEDEAVARDIRLYLKTKFEEITRERGLESAPNWYTDEDIAELVCRAGKLFVFASTIVMWINNPLYRPKDRLRQILEWQSVDSPSSPYRPLDNLYEAILRSALGPNPEEHNEIGKRIQRLLQLLVVALRPLLVSELAIILGCNEEIVRIDLGNLSAVLIIPETDAVAPVTIHHASFVGYLTDQLRCSRESPFYVAVKEAHGQVGVRCLNLRYGHDTSHNLKDSNRDHSYGTKMLPDYVSEKWQRHLERSSISSNYVLEAIERVRQVVSKRSGDMEPLYDLSSLLRIQTLRTDSIEYSYEKVKIDRQVLESLASSNGPRRDLPLFNLANGLSTLYQHNGKQELLHESIALNREALELRPQGHPSRDLSLNNLAFGLQTLSDWSEKQEFLDEAIALYKKVLELRPPGHPLRGSSLSNLASSLMALYRRNGNGKLLDQAILLYREGLELCPPDYTHRDAPLVNLAHGLCALYERSRNQELVDEAILLYQEALELCPPGHPKRDVCLISLADGLRTLYSESGDQDLLSKIITLYREGLELRPPGHPARHTSLVGLASGLCILYKQNEQQELLDEAIGLYQEAVGLCPPGHSFRNTALINLANGLSTAYQHNANQELLYKVIELNREALELRPPGHPCRDQPLINLAISLQGLYRHNKSQDLLNEVITLYREALALYSPGHPCRDVTLVNLASVLLTLYKYNQNVSLLEEAVQLGREAVVECPATDPHRPWFLRFLSRTLKTYSEVSERAFFAAEVQRLEEQANSLE